MMRFLQLCYLPHSMSESGAGIPLLLFVDRDQLRIVIREDWEEGMALLDRDYLTELITDWKRLHFEQIGPALDQLSELSVGPLKIVESGRLARGRLSDLARLIQAGKDC